MASLAERKGGSLGFFSPILLTANLLALETVKQRNADMQMLIGAVEFVSLVSASALMKSESKSLSQEDNRRRVVPWGRERGLRMIEKCTANKSGK